MGVNCVISEKAHNSLQFDKPFYVLCSQLLYLELNSESISTDKMIKYTLPAATDTQSICNLYSALSAGIKSPLLITLPNARFPNAELVAALGALTPVYTPLNVREEENKQKLTQLGLLAVSFLF